MFRRQDTPNIAARDPRLASIMLVQATLSEFSEEEQTFIVETVMRNLELNRRHCREYVLED
jgi:hypothetical protein